MALTQTLQDNFDDNSTNTAIWTSNINGSGNTITEAAGTVRITLSGTSGAYSTYATNSTTPIYDLTSSYALVQCIQATTNATTNSQAYLKVGLNTTNYMTIGKLGANLNMQIQTAGVDSTTTLAYDTVQMSWWRLINIGSNVLWQTSPDGQNWTTRRTVAPTFSISTVWQEFGGGSFGVDAVNTIIFDNFNINSPQTMIGTYSPGQTWVRRFAQVERKRTPIWFNQGVDDIPQQMNTATFLPGPAWLQRFGKNERRIFLPAAANFVAWLQNLADSVVSSDSIANKPTLNKSDSVTTSDSPVKNVTLNKIDTATSSDSISNRPTLNKTDSVTSSDTVVKNVSKALADSVASSESISKAPAKHLADSVTSSDTITTKAVVKNLVDSITLVETLLLTEGNLTESVGPPNAFTFHINDSTTSSDLISTTTVYKRSLADTVTATESVSNQPTKHLSDSVTSSESIAKNPTLNKADSVTSSDATVRAVVLNKVDTATSSDAISNQPTKKLSDSAVVSDSLLKSLVKSLADSVTSSDALAKVIGLSKTDAVTVNEAISNRFTKNLADTVVSSDLSLRYLNGVLVTGTTSTLTNTVITTNGEIVLRLAGQEQQFIRLLDGRWALRVGKKLYMVL